MASTTEQLEILKLSATAADVIDFGSGLPTRLADTVVTNKHLKTGRLRQLSFTFRITATKNVGHPDLYRLSDVRLPVSIVFATPPYVSDQRSFLRTNLRTKELRHF